MYKSLREKLEEFSRVLSDLNNQESGSQAEIEFLSARVKTIRRELTSKDNLELFDRNARECDTSGEWTFELGLRSIGPMGWAFR